MTERSRVFVVQRPAYFDRQRRGWVNKYDISPASAHGDLVFLLKPGNIYKDRMGAAMDRLHEALAEFNDNDSLLAIGDPVAIAAAVMVASQVNVGKVALLKFDRITERYDRYIIGLADSENAGS